jgi:hypothetical protein
VKHLATAAVLMTAIFSSHAQLYKCVSPSGRTEYSQSPCADQRDAAPIRGSANVINAMPQSEIRRATAPRPPTQGAPAAIIGGGGQGPSAQDIKNLETSASSITKGAKERRFLQQEVERAKAAGGQYSGDDWAALKQTQEQQSRIDAKDRERARIEAESIHMRGGSPAVQQQITHEREADQQAQADRRAAAAARSGPPPEGGGFLNCKGNGCSDVQGNWYYPRSDGTYNRSDGKVCHQQGSIVMCN